MFSSISVQFSSPPPDSSTIFSSSLPAFCAFCESCVLIPEVKLPDCLNPHVGGIDRFPIDVLLQVYWRVSGSQPEAAVQHPAAPQDHQHAAVASPPQLPAGAARPPGLRLQQRHRLRARPALRHRWVETLRDAVNSAFSCRWVRFRPQSSFVEFRKRSVWVKVKMNIRN